MTEMCKSRVKVNGQEREIEGAVNDTLLTVLRDELALTGAKRGCNQGVCGACTVLVDGRPVRACLCLAADCHDAEIETIEGLSEERVTQALQRSFAAAGAFQCGFCTPGMLVSATALLMKTLAPSQQDVLKALSGNLCRCTGYKKIVEAVLAAASELKRG